MQQPRLCSKFWGLVAYKIWSLRNTETRGSYTSSNNFRCVGKCSRTRRCAITGRKLKIAFLRGFGYGGGWTESASALQTYFAQAGIHIKLFCSSGIPLQREPLILLLCQTSSLEGLNMGKSKKNTQSQLPVILGVQMAEHLTQNKELYYWKISSQHV